MFVERTATSFKGSEKERLYCKGRSSAEVAKKVRPALGRSELFRGYVERDTRRVREEKQSGGR